MADRNPTAFLKQEYDELVAKSFDWRPRTLMGPSRPRSKVDGKRVLMLCSNNYLGLSENRLLKKAAIAAIKSHGAGSGSVRTIAGTMDLHLELEKTIARLVAQADTLEDPQERLPHRIYSRFVAHYLHQQSSPPINADEFYEKLAIARSTQ